MLFSHLLYYIRALYLHFLVDMDLRDNKGNLREGNLFKYNL